MMDDAELTIETLADQARRFSAFMGVIKPEPSDVFLLIMGKTGSGKSTFINRCTGKDVAVGHGLYSCTDSVEVFCFMQNDRRVYLIDTPGFNDTKRPDMDTLEILATYLGASYANGVRIHGLIVLHPISDNRMAGSSLQNIDMIKAVYGRTCYNNIAIVTTMWPKMSDRAEIESLASREEELMATEKYFGDFVMNGATNFRYNETGHRILPSGMVSAQDIVHHLTNQLDLCPPKELQLQHELISERKSLGDTTAGVAVAKRLSQAFHKYKQEVEGLDAKLQGLLTKADDSRASRLLEHKADFDQKLKKIEHDRTSLRKTIQDLHEKEGKAFKQKLDTMEIQLRDKLLNKERQLTKMVNSLQKICDTRIEKEIQKKQPKPNCKHQQHEEGQRKMYTQLQKDQQLSVKKVKELERMISDLKKENSKNREAYESFHEQMGNVWNGTVNGVAAGVTSGVVGLVSAFMCTVM